ncbi:hypothetical protein HPB50_026016 [Hyalomma asiaticum]|uniref:Uncharacterized protein n=1 Tax=Hyalomma asiaticum TaxID=266040 RepID=A0ACB7TP72_HYAAI|nr:hypothetical protein HPB50_026016 [Hyalomma asiaticum]
MGTCYSSKSKSASQPYSSAPMSASSSQDSALRLPRATPYTRGTVAPIDSSEVNFRRCIPPPTKYRANTFQSGNVQSKANVSVTTDTTEKSRRAVTDNADLNNPSFNNNFEDGSSSQDLTNLKKDVIASKSHNVADSLQLKTEGAKASSESSERIQYGATKIPTKITAHLSGLPKPQVAVVTTRVPPVPQRATSEKLHAAARIANQPLGDAAEKRAGCQHRVSPDKESISDRSHSGDSGSTDYDSGLGHSLSDPPAGSECGGKAQSSSTTLQVESSPVLKEGVGNELESAVLPTTLPVGAQVTAVDGTASKMGVYDQPDSYAAYRGILSYRRITPLKKYSEAPQWKRTVEPKSTKGFSSPTRAVIAKGILTKGAKAAHGAKDCSPDQKREGIAKGPPLPSTPQSPSKEEKSAGFLSPTSDGFLIDDDISDQPGLIALERSRGRGTPSVKKSIFELHALQSFSGRQTKVDRTLDDLHPLCSDAGSSCSSLGSDDLMLDFEAPCKDSAETASSPSVKYAGTPLRRVARPSVGSQAEKRNSWDSNHSDEGAALRRASDSLTSRWPLKTPPSASAGEARPRTVSLPLRPPRQVVMQECDDGSVKLDSSSYRSVCQDLNGLKTMLLKLRRILQDLVARRKGTGHLATSRVLSALQSCRVFQANLTQRWPHGTVAQVSDHQLAEHKRRGLADGHGVGVSPSPQCNGGRWSGVPWPRGRRHAPQARQATDDGGRAGEATTLGDMELAALCLRRLQDNPGFAALLTPSAEPSPAPTATEAGARDPADAVRADHVLDWQID